MARNLDDDIKRLRRQQREIRREAQRLGRSRRRSSTLRVALPAPARPRPRRRDHGRAQKEFLIWALVCGVVGYLVWCTFHR